MKYLFSFVFILSLACVYAQEIVVKDSLSGAPLPQVVVTSGKTQGTATDEKGRFSIGHFKNSDTIVLSHIAYQTKKITLEELHKIKEVLLTPAVLKNKGVTVTSARAEQNAASFKEELNVTKEEKLNYISVGDYLKNQTSLYVKDYGGAGGQKSVSSRGMSSENTMVLFNEARVNDLRTGIFDFNSVDINSIDKVVYLKSFDYDTPFSTPGGVIKLSTDAYIDSSRLALHVKINSDDLKSFGFTASTGMAGLLIRINGERCWSANNYRYIFEGNEHNRENSWLSKTFISGDVIKNGSNYSAKLYSNYSFFNSGIPGFVATNNLASSRAANKTVSTLNILNGEYYINENYSVAGNINYNYQTLVIDDPDGVIFYSNTKKESRLNDLASSIKLKYYNSGWNFNLGYEYITASLSNIAAFVSSSGVANDISRKSNRLYAGMKKSFLDPAGFVRAINITALGSYEDLSEKIPTDAETNAYSYKTGLALVPSFADYIIFKLNYGNDYRPPTFNERYYSLLYSHYDLKSEKYQWLDCGFDFNFNVWGAGQLSASYFNIKGNNKIIWIPTRMAMQIPRNVGCFQTQGFELSLVKHIIDSSFRFNASYNYTDSRNKTKTSEQDLSYDKYILYTPLHRVNLGFEADISIFRVSLSSSFISERFYSTDNLYKLPSYFLLDGSVQGSFYIAGRKNTIALTVYNITDENYFIIQSYPMPLRAFLLTYNLEIL